MELLIPGLILVALMIYASTRIKKSAARAFEAEQIDTADFSITKPEGLLSLNDDSSPYVFQAYSKDFGQAPNERIRQITANLRIFDRPDSDSIIGELKKSARKIVRQTSDNGATIIEADELIDGAEAAAFYKIATRNNRVFSLRIRALRGRGNENRRKIQEMLESFQVK